MISILFHLYKKILTDIYQLPFIDTNNCLMRGAG